jgi:LemA protein
MAAVITLIVVLVLALISTYNGLVSLSRQTGNAWAQIDLQLKRKYDLIPNLVESVRGYMKYEQETLTEIVIARNKGLIASSVSEKAIADSEVEGILVQVFSIVESYPELMASENVLSLQQELTNTENKVAFARQYYNDAVTAYNIRLESFPCSLMASLFGFKPKELFLVGERSHLEPIKVKF